MKGTIVLLLLAVTMLFSDTSYAAFPVKPAPSNTESAASAANSRDNSAKVAQHHSFFSKLIHFLMKPKAAISKPLYVVLSIFWLGWLAMGINSDFEGWEWVLSLVLYLLFWLPGFVYSLLMMHTYY